MKRKLPAAGEQPAAVPAGEVAPQYRVREGHLIEVDDITSARMARVRQKATQPELLVGQALRALGLRYRLSNRKLPGSPDFANRSAGWVLFVHGCFWHRHGCSASTTPARNREFWEAKFARNLARDQRTAAALTAQGYRVLVVWECETKRGEAPLLELLQRAFKAGQS
jgi:DNA mismatch endonuclease, patch repair protein